MIHISKRLEAAAGLVGTGKRLADVGTDHGYVPIYLREQGRIPCAVAMDINRGPLARAREHIRHYGMESYIQTRLSDGVAALEMGEADSILIAGMGGGLIIHILESGSELCKSVSELVLQPQSELMRVRQFLDENGYVVETEEMVKEDGKYYPMMRVHYEPSGNGEILSENGKLPATDGETVQEERELYYRYGRFLLERRNPVLYDYLLWERNIQEGIRKQLRGQKMAGQIAARLGEVEHTLEQNKKALVYFDAEAFEQD